MAKPTNPNNPALYAKQYMWRFIETTSLNKLEKFITEKPNDRGVEAIACYVYYAKKIMVEKDKHPNLFEQIKTFEERRFNTDLKFNKYLIAQRAVENFSTKSQKGEPELKESFRKQISDLIKENNLTVSEVSRMTNTKQSNLYNYLVKGNLSSISYDSAREVKNIILEKYGDWDED